jgi:hypothetical protein
MEPNNIALRVLSFRFRSFPKKEEVPLFGIKSQASSFPKSSTFWNKKHSFFESPFLPSSDVFLPFHYCIMIVKIEDRCVFALQRFLTHLHREC